MRKWIVLSLLLILVLSVGCAVAGGDVQGYVSVTQLQTNTILSGDTTVTIDYDVEGEQSISGKDYLLAFKGVGKCFLTFNNHSGAAVSAKSVSFENCHIILPVGASVKNGTICDASGTPASYVVIGPTNHYGIEVVDGYAYDWYSENECCYAAAGTEIGFRFRPDNCPKDKYASEQDCKPGSLNISSVKTEKKFVMPGEGVKISPVYSPQTAGILDLRSGTVYDYQYEMIMSLIAAKEFGLIKATDDVTRFDLDKDGTYDLSVLTGNEVKPISGCSITVSAVIRPPKAVRYNPLSIVFSDPTISFDANGGTGSMNSVKVSSPDLQYMLPDCTLTSPKNKSFARWDKGTPGTRITVTADTKVKAVWQDDLISYSGGVYSLNHISRTAVLMKPVSKFKTSLKIPAAVSANGQTYKVVQIQKGAFKGNKKIKTIQIGDNVTLIGAGAFNGCKTLTKVKISSTSKLKTIGACAFMNCTALKAITLPDRLQKIGKEAFYGDKNLKTITLMSSRITKKSAVGADCFRNISAKAVFRVPKKMLNKYKNWFINKGKAPAKSKFEAVRQ